MKKFLSVFLSAVMLTGLLTVFASANGTLYYRDDFSDGFRSANWVIDKEACHYKYDTDRKCIFGYEDAKVLQPNYGGRNAKVWDQFYASYRVQFTDYGDTLEENFGSGNHAVTVWYRDLFQNEDEFAGPVYTFKVNVDTQKAEVVKEASGLSYKNEANVTVTGVSFRSVLASDIDVSFANIQRGEKAPYFTIGMKVSSGKIECYVNEKCVFTSTVDANDEKVGPYALHSVDATVGSQKAPLLLINDYCYLSINNYEVWSADYDFSASLPGDADKNGTIGVNDAIIVLKHIAQWKDIEIDLDAADVNVDGKIDTNDAILILKKVAGWDVVLGQPQK